VELSSIFGDGLIESRGQPDRDAQRHPARSISHSAWSAPCWGRGAEANMAKMFAAEASWADGEACTETHGGVGFAAADENITLLRAFSDERMARRPTHK
jgi:alkylation response protein AidB-like acyl-CoA dehydrogenase